MIRVEQVRKAFQLESSTFVAVQDVSCSIEPGSFVTLVGPSGCGKSTLLQMIAGLTRPTSGRITFNGAEISEPPFEMVYVFQQYTKSIFPWKTVRENVAFGVRHRKSMPAREMELLVATYIELMELQGFEDYFPSQLSGGMQQRVAIARALACQPAVLLMDEPFSSLDEFTRASLQNLMLHIWARQKLTVLFVTHDVEEAVYLSTRALVMCPRPGRVVEDIPINIPFPRSQLTTRERPDFLECRRRIFKSTFGDLAEKSYDVPA
jgi:NitT/TauT family transport system ATP-binding protein